MTVSRMFHSPWWRRPLIFLLVIGQPRSGLPCAEETLVIGPVRLSGELHQHRNKVLGNLPMLGMETLQLCPCFGKTHNQRGLAMGSPTSGLDGPLSVVQRSHLCFPIPHLPPITRPSPINLKTNWNWQRGAEMILFHFFFVIRTELCWWKLKWSWKPFN